MLVVVSHPLDPHALVVLEALRERGGDAFMFDTARFPVDARLAIRLADGEAWRAELEEQGVTRELTDVRVVWWRRPQPFELHDTLTDREDRAFAYGECQHAIAGMWSTLNATWINDPARDEAASRKVWQLKVAPQLGLRTPRTCITNDPEHARRFICEQDGADVIYKAFGGTDNAWRETRVLRPDEHELLDHVRYAPVIFQEHVPAVTDIRITVVGEEVYAAEIHSQQTAYPHDFRMDMDNAEVRAHSLPAEIEHKLRTLMALSGLVYGAVDMRLTPDGEYVFLEINPAGQWLFIEQLTGQPITDALCRFMIAHDRPPVGVTGGPAQPDASSARL